MKLRILDDSVEISGYVNAIERNSKPLMSRIGKFIERVCKGAFSKALKRNDDVKLLLNHDPGRELGSTQKGNLELTEDSIGLYARATVTDEETCQKARNGELIGWSFGFYDTEDGVEQGIDEETKLPLRKLRDMELEEVSILDNTKIPAYDGTLVSVRTDGTGIYYAEPMISDDVEIREEQPKQHNNVEPIDYTVYENMISEMKGEK